MVSNIYLLAGELKDLFVVDNLSDHLIGNVYAKFFDEKSKKKHIFQQSKIKKKDTVSKNISTVLYMKAILKIIKKMAKENTF